jgi:hypothetical protein
VEQAISRALRENLERLQRTTSELNQAIADLVAACASSRPANALPPMLRAQTAAASLAAALEVLAKFVASAPQPSPGKEEVMRVVAIEPPEPPSMPTPPPHTLPVPMAESSPAVESEAETIAECAEEPVAEAPEVEVGVEPPAAFDLASLTREQRELHRRADRVAKVSMQDIQMLKPEQVRLGRQHRDLCLRLRDDIEKARREYDRRFQSIMDHPVDHFYYWMVEILAGGNPEALGEYPYPSPVLRR